MKKLIILSIATLFSIGMYAQKYATRTGKVTFFSSTSIENIEAFNNEASAAVDATNGSVLFIIPIKSFKFEKALMQEHFNDNYMESDKYPKATFKGKITNLSSINFAKNGTYNATVSGTMTIHGVTKNMTATGKVTVKNGSININSKFHVKVADYKISIPSVAKGKIADNIEVTVNSDLNKK